MADYNFLSDVLDTYQSFSDGMKFVWAVTPPLTVLGLTAIILHFRLKTRLLEREATLEEGNALIHDQSALGQGDSRHLVILPPSDPTSDSSLETSHKTGPRQGYEPPRIT